LWATDGCIHPPHGSTRHPTIYYATSSEGLARDVQSLLLRLRINAVVRPISQHGKGRTQFHVMVMGRNDILAFAERLGAVGESRGGHLCQCVEWVKTRVANTNRDVLPREVWPVLALPAMMTAGLTHRQMQAALGNAYCGHNLYKQNISRERAARLAAVVHSQVLAALSQSDVYWDEITAIEPQGETAVYDLTVDRLHNFVAGDIIAHNSIEQDSDVVIFVYREEMYGPTEENAGIAEIIIGKQRNGPTGTVRLAFLKEFTRFENLWHE
jgi:replicative DNA helicase